jgi:membrane protein DedA with SNARE-associated domain
MTHFVDHIVGLHGLTVYAVVGALVLAETALFVGFVVPGETAAIIGGVVASRGNASLSAMCVLVVIMAIIGDTIGYAIGARWGDQVLHTRIFRKRTGELEHAEAVLRRRGGPAVFLGRFIAFLRAVMPFLAGSSHLRYRRFFAYNATGGLIWGVGSVLLGYLAGSSYEAVERVAGPITAAVVAVIVIAAVVVWQVHRRRGEARLNRAAAAEEREPAEAGHR